MSVLDRIVQTKQGEVSQLGPRREDLRALALDAPEPRAFARALSRPDGVQLLAEVKRRSPSAGEIRPGADPVEVARAYEAGGAAALSVLTDGPYFGGDLQALAAVREAVSLPVLRKDFVIDPLQVWEARSAGADAVLLIVRILEDPLLGELAALAAELGMDALLEAHDERELERALSIGGTLIGVNNRDLQSFTTDLSVTLTLAPRVPAEATLVAESGIRTGEDVAKLGAAGVDAVLVGESLMRQTDLQAAAAGLVGRAKRPGGRR